MATPFHRVLNFRTGSIVSSYITAAPDWLGVYALRRVLEVHADGGRLGPWGWTKPEAGSADEALVNSACSGK